MFYYKLLTLIMVEINTVSLYLFGLNALLTNWLTFLLSFVVLGFWDWVGGRYSVRPSTILLIIITSPHSSHSPLFEHAAHLMMETDQTTPNLTILPLQVCSAVGIVPLSLQYGFEQVRFLISLTSRTLGPSTHVNTHFVCKQKEKMMACLCLST